MGRFFLIGFMGAGKTTVGQELAKKTNSQFYDTDLIIEQRFNKKIAQLFDDLGEVDFRLIEKNIIDEISNFQNVIISTGGGTPCFHDNIYTMLNNGIVIYLEASPETLFKRLENEKLNRPLLRNKSNKELLNFISHSLINRRKFYEKAQIIFNTDDILTKEELILDIDNLITKINNI